MKDIKRITKQHNCGLIRAKEIYIEELAEKRLQTIEAHIVGINVVLAKLVDTLDRTVAYLEGK